MSLYEVAFRILAIAVLCYIYADKDSNQKENEPNIPQD